jgi:hypothetical protein
MPSLIISLPGARGPSSGVPLGSKLTHLSESAVHGSTTKPTAASTKPASATAQATLFAPTHIVTQSKTH